ncbi:NAD-dependent epimerase/dehydratase [Pseudarthrobacter chlorophenolicus A6]|uniref:NAD-dependent epimerase/dehydratase n=1 Tax=Pseudarthrobacter chlorophenolicus (strain ATCC 700700 / DSM 12829 / CIP 107037 / JCM 12360 / KCTC 9906 / NCIMB 13794 / A6) TaxID=452863 RepID=B8HGQ5_PSECP|nr:SDR family oxidoreductase [Pseudarthrobacter chlorophenolicus]ACL41321.1 NAD-dependent epimerase/dehydratase [Pseudarthrobacter chlorophenolicus A6]SDQ66276.1 Nucleoside-diphosphate-sugar epimerase [Pseudarthrobacter chlorophenolicus]
MTIGAGTAAGSGRTALVVGATGISGSALVDTLVDDGWSVLALSRRPGPQRAGVTWLSADLTSASALAAVLAPENPSHVFFTAWSRQATEEENIAVNAGMVRDLLAALRGKDVSHVALMTGLKHYLGPFEAYAAGEMPDTPFHEEEPRLPVNNFYYAQEDQLWAAAEEQGFTWSVHRAHTVIGHAVGNAMNMGLTLAAQATLCRDSGQPFVFPGSETQWNGLTDMTDAGLLAEHMLWASTTPEAANEAFNIVNGDVFRWRWMWPKLAAYFGLEWEGYQAEPRTLEQSMAGREDQWRELAERHNLTEPDLDRVASWWHTDGALGRNIEVVTDMGKSRDAGFTGYRRTLDAFTALFDRYRADRLIP